MGPELSQRSRPYLDHNIADSEAHSRHVSGLRSGRCDPGGPDRNSDPSCVPDVPVAANRSIVEVLEGYPTDPDSELGTIHFDDFRGISNCRDSRTNESFAKTSC